MHTMKTFVYFPKSKLSLLEALEGNFQMLTNKGHCYLKHRSSWQPTWNTLRLHQNSKFERVPKNEEGRQQYVHVLALFCLPTTIIISKTVLWPAVEYDVYVYFLYPVISIVNKNKCSVLHWVFAVERNDIERKHSLAFGYIQFWQK